MIKRNLMRSLALALAGTAVLLGGCFGDDVTPQNTAIAGSWNVVCQPVNEDCTNFAIRFDEAGDIADVDIDGHKGAQRGTGQVVDGVLFFRMGVGTVYEFRGKLDGGGRAATGTMKNFDADGTQRSTSATATRG